MSTGGGGADLGRSFERPLRDLVGGLNSGTK